MPRAIRHNVPEQVATNQRQIAENVEDLVPGRLVAEADLVVDRPPAAVDHLTGTIASMPGGGYQSEAAISPVCSDCGLQLPIISTIAPKSPHDACACCQWSAIPSGDS